METIKQMLSLLPSETKKYPIIVFCGIKSLPVIREKEFIIIMHNNYSLKGIPSNDNDNGSEAA
jgi:hypothetical protein